MWNLCLALWGDLDTTLSDEVSASRRQSEDSYASQQARREALSRWLSEQSSELIEDEVLNGGTIVSGFYCDVEHLIE